MVKNDQKGIEELDRHIRNKYIKIRLIADIVVWLYVSSVDLICPDTRLPGWLPRQAQAAYNRYRLNSDDHLVLLEITNNYSK